MTDDVIVCTVILGLTVLMLTVNLIIFLVLKHDIEE